jgi:D-tyrosyl-tRNA(Tyr) deacylase
MRAVVQRVRSARVEVHDEIVGSIDEGLCAFLGVSRTDGDADVRYVANKLACLRVFADESGKMTRSVQDIGGSILLVSQFTLFGDVRRGHRPSFTEAMEPGEAERRVLDVVGLLEAQGVTVRTGRFGADMRVVVDNHGPVTILVDSTKTF